LLSDLGGEMNNDIAILAKSEAKSLDLI